MRHISFLWTAPAFRARRKTYGDRRIGRIRLTAAPVREWTNEAPESDWEAEGFGYMESIGGSVHGIRPRDLWRQWMEEPVLMWVVRFEIIEVVDEVVAVDVQTRAP